MRVEVFKDREDSCVVTFNGKKLRITPHDDGRIRLRFIRGGPLFIQEAFLTGAEDDVLLSVVPEGWRNPNPKKSRPQRRIEEKNGTRNV